MDKRSLVGYGPWGRKRVGHNLVTEHTHNLQQRTGQPPP